MSLSHSFGFLEQAAELYFVGRSATPQWSCHALPHGCGGPAQGGAALTWKNLPCHGLPRTAQQSSTVIAVGSMGPGGVLEGTSFLLPAMGKGFRRDEVARGAGRSHLGGQDRKDPAQGRRASCGADHRRMAIASRDARQGRGVRGGIRTDRPLTAPRELRRARCLGYRRRHSGRQEGAAGARTSSRADCGETTKEPQGSPSPPLAHTAAASLATLGLNACRFARTLVPTRP